MSQNLPVPEIEFRQAGFESEWRTGILTPLLAFCIGTALAVIVTDRFEGRALPAAILGLLEILLIMALVWTGILRIRHRRSLEDFSDLPEIPQLRTYTRQLLREHLAYRTVFKTLVAGTDLDAILSSVADAAESILPGCSCCFIECFPEGSGMRLAPRVDSDSSCRAFAPSMSPKNVEVFSRISREMPELNLADATTAFDEHTTELLRARGVSACQLYAIFLSNGQLWGILSLWYPKDISETVRSEASVLVQLATTAIDRSLLIRHLEDKTKRMLLAERAGKVGIWDWDLKTSRVIWSEQMEALNLMAPGSFDGTYEGWRHLVVPEDLVQVEKHLHECFREKAQDYYHTYRVKLSDGQIHWMESFGAISYDGSSTPVRMVGTCHDITKHKELLARSEEDRKRLELVIDAVRLGFWDWHIPSGQVEFGGYWTSMLGYSPKEIAPNVRAWEELVHPDDLARVLQVLNKHLAGETSIYECEHRLKKRDGSWLWVLDRGRVVERDAENRPIRALGIHTDVSEHRAVQEALKLAAKRKDEFLATLAHELRNPLAPIRTGLQILKRAVSEADRQRAQDMMERQLLQMVRLIDDLLDVARITQGRIELKKSAINLRDAVEAGLEAAKPLIDAAWQTLTVEMPDKPITLNGDSVRLAQVVSNIVSNAAKYTPQGGSIHVRLSRSNGTASIAVSDNGLGIPSDMLSAVFEMFGQVNQTLDRSQGGLGIGLAIVQKIVEMHGGDVRAESPGIGQGSTFTIHLPALPEERPSLVSAGTAPPVERFSSPHDVLVIDDNKDVAESLALFTSLLGHAAVVAHNGGEAFEKMKEKLPDTVFLDIGLPGMSGYEVAREIRKMHGGDTVKLIALTGWGTEDDKRKALEAGFSEHLTKPVDMAHIERILGHARATTPSPQGESGPHAGQSL